MNVKYIYRNMYPGDNKEREKAKEVTVEDAYSTTTAQIETSAVLDTPGGYYLYKILFPGITFQYTRQGKRTVSRDIDV
ncbi:hypothetical protein [Parabacteroides sp. PF5-9]|uniref:hypothetical protein n=1 Tax=Parabacteroides sp. PF5-9 TaxID=1742404 RepID=UPI002474DE2D|nr:hypothetical protein [Parabacteroides sp. PF5-9]MDH6357225.1 hypothetical protein [Parabacteroides sp. PF5-9]